jgi:hypothetical protein
VTLRTSSPGKVAMAFFIAINAFMRTLFSTLLVFLVSLLIVAPNHPFTALCVTLEAMHSGAREG